MPAVMARKGSHGIAKGSVPQRVCDLPKASQLGIKQLGCRGLGRADGGFPPRSCRSFCSPLPLELAPKAVKCAAGHISGTGAVFVLAIGKANAEVTIWGFVAP